MTAECTCLPYSAGGFGPEEDCPVHGRQVERPVSRWMVEVAPHSFEDVGAHALELEGGCLVFRDETYKITVAYAATAWKSVTEGSL